MAGYFKSIFTPVLTEIANEKVYIKSRRFQHTGRGGLLPRGGIGSPKVMLGSSLVTTISID